MGKDKPYHKTVFPNGVRLITIPVAGVGSIATSVMVAVGSRYETPEINGVSHFLEHMVFKGTAKYPTTDDVNVIERQGGLQNAYTDIDITNYHNKVLSTDWQLALDVNRELALAPRLEQKYVDLERNVILEEMKRYEDEPAAKVEESFHQMLYPATSLGMRIIGEEKPLKAASAVTLKTYHDRWYQPGSIVVVLAGKIDPAAEAKIKDQVTAWFGSLRANPSGTFVPVTDEQDKPRLTVVTKPDASQAHLMLGIRSFARSSKDRFAWSLFNLLMGVSFTSRLFRQIREKRGLCYHIRSSSSNWSDVGYWSIYAGVATDKVSEATAAILAELTKAREKGITAAEVAVAKKRLKTILAFRSEDPEFINEYYGRQELFGEPILSIADYIARIEAVTHEDVNSLLAKYITAKTLNMSLVWNRGKDEKLAGLLRL